MPLSMEDHQQVQDLMVRYAFAVDIDGTEEEFLKIFTEDALLIGPKGHHEGVQGIKDFARRIVGRKEIQLRHFITNCLIDGDGDRATIKAYFVEFLTYKNLIPPKHIRTSEVLYVGTYDCVARKVDKVWRLQERIVNVDAP